MYATMLYGPRDIRFEEREDPKIIHPTDAIIRLAATSVCGSDRWPYRGINAVRSQRRWVTNIADQLL
jgi:threonine dehydrogenase-like Zn-dependent dehydrogenase